jgi:ATPase subunit of ABC transporter with duplicated ATPase domains
MTRGIPLVEVEAMTAGYDSPVVGPISLSLTRGEAVGIMGPNGCGKSTFLAALSGASRVFSGRIEKRAGLSIAFLRQKPLPVRGIPFSASELLALAGAGAEGLPRWLVPHLHERLDTLSGGQLQFFTLLACLGTHADVVLLDEPTNNLDAASVANLVTLLRQKTAEGSGLLVVSHDMKFIDAVCDRRVAFG